MATPNYFRAATRKHTTRRRNMEHSLCKAMQTTPRRRGLNTDTVTRAVIAHTYCSLSPCVSIHPLRGFLKNWIPLIPGASEICGSVRTLRRYVNLYNEGTYDGALMWLGVSRVRWPKNFRRVEKLIEEQVVSSLAELPGEELKMMGYKQILSVLREFQQLYQVTPYVRGYRWALRLRAKAIARLASSVDEDIAATVESDNSQIACADLQMRSTIPTAMRIVNNNEQSWLLQYCSLLKCFKGKGCKSYDAWERWQHERHRLYAKGIQSGLTHDRIDTLEAQGMFALNCHVEDVNRWEASDGNECVVHGIRISRVDAV